MNIDTNKPFHIGFSWEDGPTDSYETLEEALKNAKQWKVDEPNCADIYVWQLIKII